jgi:hypothetical protein
VEACHAAGAAPCSLIRDLLEGLGEVQFAKFRKLQNLPTFWIAVRTHATVDVQMMPLQSFQKAADKALFDGHNLQIHSVVHSHFSF